MSGAVIATRLVEALEAAAAREGATALVSVNIDVLAHDSAGKAEATLVRKTRTLVFMNAELRTDSGDRIATASSVHKVVA